MRKRIISILVSITAFIIFFSYSDVFAAQNVRVNLPSFKVAINGEEINNTYSQYPLITYKDITYFPMTYEGCRYLGLETKWDNKSGLEIIKTDVGYPYSEYISKTKNTSSYYASKPSFNIKVNGESIDNQKEEYPLLIFRDITYFPLTWRFGVDEFGWDYRFSNASGLEIKSKNPVPKELKLYDYFVDEHKPDDETYYYGGQFILSEDNIYYSGNKGAIYKAPLNNLKNYIKIYDLPLNDIYFPEGTYAYPYFENRNGEIYFTYHVGGATMGSTYEVKINRDATVSKPVSIGLGVGISPYFSNGYALDWSSTGTSHGYKVPRYETENYDYLVAFKENIEKDLSRIYKLNKSTNEISLISDKPAIGFNYRDGKIYFISDNKLYSFKVQNDIVEIASNGPVAYYEALNGHIYYQNADDGKIYKEGIREPLNSGEKCYMISRTDDYAVLNFQSTVKDSYKTIIYNKDGIEIFKTPKKAQVISAYSNKIAYYDDFENKVYLLEVSENSKHAVNQSQGQVQSQKNIFINNTADSKITTEVTSLSQYKYGVAKICVDGRWFYIDKKGNEVSSVQDLSIVKNINIPNAKPLLEYNSIEKVDDILLLTGNNIIQCVDLNNGKMLYEGKGKYYYDVDERDEGPTGHYRTALGNNQRAVKISNDNEEVTFVVNVDTKEVLKVYCFRGRIQEGLYQYKENNLFGFKNMHNQVVIPAKHPQSPRNTLFTEGFATMLKSDKDDKTFVVYDRKGTVVFEIYLDYQDGMSQFSDGFARIGRKYLYGFIDTAGKVVIEPQYATATSFSNGISIVSKNGKYGVINKAGEVLIPLEYDSIQDEAYSPDKDKYSYYKYRLNPNYPIVAQKNGKWGYVSFPSFKEESRAVVPFIYDDYPVRDIRSFPSDYNYTTQRPYTVFKANDKFYAVGVTSQGEILTSEGYDMLGYEFLYGLLQVENDGKIGFLNTNFEIAVPLKYTRLAYSSNPTLNTPCFMDDVACVSNGEKLILIDRHGNELLYFN